MMVVLCMRVCMKLVTTSSHLAVRDAQIHTHHSHDSGGLYARVYESCVCLSLSVCLRVQSCAYTCVSFSLCVCVHVIAEDISVEHLGWRFNSGTCGTNKTKHEKRT